MAKRARILLACVKEGYTRLFAVLSGHELTYVSTLSDADAALKADGFNMVMIGVHFDESRMFDLLEHVRVDANYSRVPVICFRGAIIADTEIEFAMEGTEVACKAMGANAFFDLLAFTDDALGNAAVLTIINSLLVGGCR